MLQSKAQILDLLLELREKLGTSIIMITHDLGVISRLCDRVVVMYGGKIVEKGEIGEIFYNTAHPYTKGLMQSIAKLDTAKGEKTETDRRYTSGSVRTSERMSVCSKM